jgi:hypothetical protein
VGGLKRWRDRWRVGGGGGSGIGAGCDVLVLSSGLETYIRRVAMIQRERQVRVRSRYSQGRVRLVTN